MIDFLNDTDKIKNVLQEFSGRLASLQRGEAYIESMAQKFKENAVFLRVSENNETVAFSAFYCNDQETKNAFLSMIAVSEKYEGKGYGKMILSEVEYRCMQSGMTSLILEVNKKNLHAVKFYEKNGFVFLNRETDKSFFMRKMLVMEE